MEDPARTRSSFTVIALFYPVQTAGKKLDKEERQTVCKEPIGSTNPLGKNAPRKKFHFIPHSPSPQDCEEPEEDRRGPLMEVLL